MAATVWRGRLAFGMVAIPVRLYKAARRERIRFRQVYRPPAPSGEGVPIGLERAGRSEPDLRPQALSPELPDDEPEAPPVAAVHRAAVAEPQGEPLDKSEILKGYEVEKDRYAVFQPGEVAALRPRTSTELEIAQFVRLGEIDPIFFDASYYVAPDRGGEKPYALLFRALQQSGYAALGSLAMHGREHAAAIRPGTHGLILHTMFYLNEVRREEEYDATAQLVNPKELELALTLVRTAAGPFDPATLKDRYEERLRALVESRAGSVLLPSTTAPAAEAPPAGDILEALRRSIEAARKPAAREVSARPDTGRKKPRRRTA